MAITDPILQAGAGVFGQARLQMVIEPLAGGIGRDNPFHASTVS